MAIHLDVISAERMVFSDQVDSVTCPGTEGELGILPHHTHLATLLNPGEVRFQRNGEETILSIGGGFLEVRPDRVVILADVAERAEDIDIERAEAARQRAQERIREGGPAPNRVRAEASLRRSVARIKVARRVRESRRRQPPTTS